MSQARGFQELSANYAFKRTAGTLYRVSCHSVGPQPLNASLGFNWRTHVSHRLLYAAVALVLCNTTSAEATVVAKDPLEPVYGPCGDMPLSQVREVDFMMFYPTEKQAVNAAAEVDDATFGITVRTSASTIEWVVRAVYLDLPSSEAHLHHAEVIERIARRHGSKDHAAGCGSHYYRR